MDIKSSHLFEFAGKLPYADFNIIPWAPGRSMDWHEHSFFQMIHVLEGELLVDYGQGWEPLEPHALHVLPPGHKHRLRTDSGHYQLGLNFTPEQDERGLLQLLRSRFTAPNILLQPVGTGLLPALRQCASSLLSQLQCAHRLDQYVLSLLQPPATSAPPAFAERIAAYISQHRHESIRVEEAARELDVSRATLQRQCKCHFNCGFAELHERERMKHACELLLDVDLNITDCAESCGYPEVYSFSRAFKRVYGTAPTAYRQELIQRLS